MDTLGLIIAVVVAAASATDNAIGIDLLDKVVEYASTVARVYVDAGFKDEVMIHGAVRGIAVEQVKRRATKPETTHLGVSGTDICHICSCSTARR